MTNEEARQFGLNLLHGIVERNKVSYPCYADNVQQAIDALTPSLPSNLDEAAEDSWAVYEYRESPKGLYSTCYVDGFEAGAKWMAGQGITFEGKATRKYEKGWGEFFSWILFDQRKAANLLVEQGKEADVIINIRKKQPGESLKEKEDENK